MFVSHALQVAQAFSETSGLVRYHAKRVTVTLGLSVVVLYAAYVLAVVAFFAVFAAVGGYVGYHAGRYQRVRIARAGGFVVVTGTFMFNATEGAIALAQDVVPAIGRAQVATVQKVEALQFYFAATTFQVEATATDVMEQVLAVAMGV